MFEKVKGKFVETKKESQFKREERKRIAREKAEEKARIEFERIQAEKDALMALSEKELMVEAIMVLRGYNSRITNIEEQQDDLLERVNSIECDVSSLETTVSGLNND